MQQNWRHIHRIVEQSKNPQRAAQRQINLHRPDVWSDEVLSPYFTESKTLMRRWVQNARLPEGIYVRVGRWDIPASQWQFLSSSTVCMPIKTQHTAACGSLYQVDSLHAYGDYDEGCAFARAAAEVIKSIITFNKSEHSHTIAHFDEWTTAMGLLTLKADMPEVATVFTTHATSIGRSICGNGKPLYDQLKNYNGDQMAEELNMQSKHSLEKLPHGTPTVSQP